MTSRTIALEQLKRQLLEELGSYLESETEVKNYELTRDQVSVMTAGIVNTEIIEEQWDGQTYHLKAKMVVDPDRVARIVDDIRRDRQKTRELEKLKKNGVGCPGGIGAAPRP